MICALSGESLVQMFNELFVEKYNNLNIFAKGDGDLLHKNYIKIVDRFNVTSFTAKTVTMLREKIMAYTKSSIYNTFRTEKTLEKFNTEIGYETEERLQLEEKQYEEEKLERNRIEFVTIRLFDYIQKHYSQEDAYVFRVYFLYDSRNKKITYKQLSTITGYSISKCCGIVQKIKQDLKDNLGSYIDGTNRQSKSTSKSRTT